MSSRRRSLPRVVAVAGSAWPYGGEGEAAEAAGALAAGLLGRGHDVELVVADGAAVRRSELARGRARREPFNLRLGELELRGELWRCSGRDEMTVWVVAHEELFGLRAGEPALGPLRAAFLCAGALQVARRGERPAEILHLHGPEAALAAVMLSTTHAEVPELGAVRTVFTVRDLAATATFGREILGQLGLPAGLFHPQLLEHLGGVSLLKAGLVFADALVLPSPRAAREALRHGSGHGLEGLLGEREADLHGIAEGVDAAAWDPATDPHLAQAYSDRKPHGKVRCAAALRAELGLEADARAPLLGFGGSLTAADGADLLVAALPALVRQGAQIAIAGGAWSGKPADPDLDERFQAAAAQFAGRVAVIACAGEGERGGERSGDGMGERMGERMGLLRRLLAGSDLLLLPSREEASGGLALRALRYGALPVAHAVGALVDLFAAESGGVLFRAPSAPALARAVARALAGFGTPAWRTQVLAAMEQPISWAGSVRRHADLMKSVAKQEPRRIPVGALPDERDAPEPYLDWGPAPPERYGEDVLGLLVQGPRSLYAYWEVAPSTLGASAAEAAVSGAGGDLRLRLVVDGQSFEVAAGLGDRGELWLAAEPGRSHALELVTAAGDVLVRSAVVETPREAPSQERDVEWVRHAPRLQHAPEAAVEAEEPPQPLYHFGAEGMVGRFGPSAWQLAAAGNWESLDRDFGSEPARGDAPRAVADAAGETPAAPGRTFAGSSGLRPGRSS